MDNTTQGAKSAADRAAASTNDIADRAKDMTTEAANQASSIAGDIREKASHAIEVGKETAASVADSVTTHVADFARDASKTLRETIEEQKSAGAGAIADLAKSARESADGFEQQSPQIASAVRTVAGKVESISNDVKDKTVAEMIDSMSAFAQRQPIAFLGCGIVAGLVLSRLLAPGHRS